jgi:hypothetical protein
MSDGYATTAGKGYTYDKAGNLGVAKGVLYGGFWKHDPHHTHRLLLGYEATGGGRPMAVGAGEYHLITRLKSVMARYIFLLPSPYGKQIMPLRAKVGLAMTEAFEMIRAGMEEAA